MDVKQITLQSLLDLPDKLHNKEDSNRTTLESEDKEKDHQSLWDYLDM
ncbi:hypothetical protein [Shimazuella kribbensis]|nr:hypothetical protein [Shimazuella kribbensis]